MAVTGDLASVEAAVDTIAGRVAASWRRSDEALSLDLQVPVGSSGEVHVPLLWPGARIMESGKLLWRAGHAVETLAGIALAGEDDGRVVFKVDSGAYAFEVRKTA